MALSDRPFGPVSRGATVPPIALNTQAATASQASTLPVNQAIAVTTETLIFSGPLPASPLSCAVPPATALEQTVFDFFASGYIKTTAEGNITIKLYEGINPIIADNILLGSSGAIAQASTTAPFFAHMQLIYDSVSGKLTGTVDFYVNETIVAKATLSNFPTGISNLNDPVCQFSMTVTSSGATAGTLTTVNVQKFTVG